MAATMKLVFVLFVFLYVDSCKPENLTMGTNVNAKLAYTENVELAALPLVVRTKNVFFNGNSTIKGIYAVDKDETEATVKVTAGGVGFEFTNVKLKGERGNGLNYEIQIYV